MAKDALCQIMYSLAGLFWRNDLGCASVIPSEQTASSYIILYVLFTYVNCSCLQYSFRSTERYFLCPRAPSLSINVSKTVAIGLASDDVRKLSNAWQRGKLVLNKGSAPYKSMLGEKSLTCRSFLFLRREVRTVLTTPSQLSASHFKR